MKQPFFDTTTLAAAGGESKILGGINCVKFKSVSGTVRVRFNSAGPIPVATGDVFEVPFPFTWHRVEVTTESGASCVWVYGFGSFGGGGGGGSGSAQMVTGDGAPVAAPDDPTSYAIYYDRTGAAIYNWNTTAQAWE